MKTKIFFPLLVVCLLFAGFGGQVAGAETEPAHPRLYFSEQDLDNLKALKTTPSHSTIWNNISSWADSHVNDPPPAEDPSSFVLALAICQYIERMGLMYSMTDDEAYAAAARDWMLSVSGWSSWGIETYGHRVRDIARGFAFGYDVLYDYLTSSERNTIKDAMVAHVGPVYDYWKSATHGSDFSTSYATAGCAIGMAGFALEGDYDGASDWISLGTSLTQQALSYGGIDGGWNSGLSYGPIALFSLTTFSDILKRNTGQDLFDNDFLRQSPYYYIYCTYNSRPLQLEDSNWWETYGAWHRRNWPNLTAFYRLGAEYQNRYSQWFADQYLDEFSEDIHAYIWKDPDITATPPTGLPLTRHFRDLGYVIFKTGWGDDDLLFVLKSGSSIGHAHPSQNEFQIYFAGVPITGGPGYVVGTDMDATWSHNCILVDGMGQGQELGDYATLPLGTRGEILAVDVNDPYYRYVLGDASAVYTGTGGSGAHAVGDLDKWLRHIVFMENPDYFVVYDEVAASEAKQFDWLLQAPSIDSDTGNISVTGTTIPLVKDGLKLVVDVLEPDTFLYETVPYDNSSYIKLHPTEDASSVHFLTVHFPLAEEGSALPTEKVSVGNVIGARVIDEGNLDLILFSADGNPVDEYIELGGSYEAADGGSYIFQSTGVRAQFDSYQVMSLRRHVISWWLIIGIVAAVAAIGIFLYFVIRRRRAKRGVPESQQILPIEKYPK